MAMFLKICQFYGRFLMSFTAIGYWWRSLFWDKTPPNFTGQLWLVTGASGGLGKAIVQSAVRGGATVIAAARSGAKLHELVAETGSGKVIPLQTDLALQSETEAMVAKLVQDGRKIDVLVNNVGILNNDFELTVENREASFATNILTHFLLTERLIEKGLFRPDAVVIEMSSGGMYNAPLMVDKMNVTNPKYYRGVFAYAVHKRGQVELTKYWQDTYGPRGMHFYVMHPGWAETAGVQRSLPRFYKILNSVLRSSQQGTDTAIWLADNKPNAMPVAFWFDRAPRAEHVFDVTRQTKDTPASLAAYLRRELSMT